MIHNSKFKKYSVEYIINKIHINELKVKCNMHRDT